VIGSRDDALYAALSSEVQGEVRFDPASRGIYSTDAGPYQIIPDGVVIPRDAEDVKTTLRVCREHGVPITARGGGTSQAGQTVGRGIQLDFSKYMRAVLEVDADRRRVRVQPGIVVAELNEELAPLGLELPLDLSTANRATIGGMIANNSSGTRSVLYGMTVDYVESLEVLLADGSVAEFEPVTAQEFRARATRPGAEGTWYRTVAELTEELGDEIRFRFPRVFRRVGGYSLDAFVLDANGRPLPLAADRHHPTLRPVQPEDRPLNLCRLIAGSEGTLGLILSATLRLTPLPRARVLGVAQFATLRDALSATSEILRHGPSAVEVMDRPLLEMTAGKPEFEPLRDFIVGDPGAILIIEFIGDSAHVLQERLEGVADALRGHDPGAAFHRALDPASQARVWKLRKAGLGLSMSQTGDTKGVSFVEDTAVHPGDLPDYIDAFQEILARHQARAVFYAHASVGLMHVRPAIDMKTEEGVARFESIASDVADLVLRFGGSLSAEHGDGMTRSPFQERMYGAELYEGFRRLKKALDPDGILNPGKIVDPAPLASNLRYGPNYLTNVLPTVFSFDDFGGISRAAEQCGGVGACRKAVTGTMCPSYMATRDEADNTRGRATALRLAISGQLGPGGLTDPGLFPVMDLCVECKACKTECPTGVDMARMKSEFLYHYQYAHGASLRTRMLARGEAVARWDHRLPWFTGAAVHSGVARSALETWVGIDARRALPRAARETFVQWASRNPAVARWSGGGVFRKRVPESADLAIFPDTFTNFYEPRHPRALTRIALAVGRRPLLPPRVCCGRPLISKGFLKQARRQAERVARVYAPLAEAGMPIVFSEPGCYSAVRDDHPDLVRPAYQDRSRAVAEAAVTGEEWAAEAVASSGPELQPAADGEFLVHGHCHQKALVGMGPAESLLRTIPGAAVRVLDTACCGMAGSFGYEKEHYDVSVRMAERRLLPAIRNAEPGTTVVAPGFSCRHQINDLAAVGARSTLEVVADHLP
jgi:FAD/FMN-containing dehydrogenase/Fe-S oxidoreductase